MAQNQHYITIKGTKDGLIFILDDTCSFDDILTELTEKLSSNDSRYSGGPLMAVKLHSGNRYLTEQQRQQIRDIILKEKNLLVEEFESNVITKAEAENMAKQQRVTSVTQIVRSGQQLEVTGDLLLIGDVNSGALVKATGNIYVVGVLRGSAHAGSEGDTEAVIAASVMTPSQLAIADVVCPGADVVHTESEVACAFIDHNRHELMIDRVQRLHQRPIYSSNR